jgi:6,7-dimethyl-8-ribityllumazine synthase
LVRSALSVLQRAGLASRVTIVQVPGAFELPVTVARIVHQRPRPDAVIALGVLIKGQTPQYAVIAQAVANGLTQVAVFSRVPVTFGVIVAETLAQAKARAGLSRRGASGNRGAEAALAALAAIAAPGTLRLP